MANIISVSKDLLLLRTRALMLEGERHSVTSCLGVRQALEQLDKDHVFDLLLLGHTLSEQERGEIAVAAVGRNPSLRIVVIRSGELYEDTSRQPNMTICGSIPEQVLECVRRVLDRSNPNAADTSLALNGAEDCRAAAEQARASHLRRRASGNSRRRKMKPLGDGVAE